MQLLDPVQAVQVWQKAIAYFEARIVADSSNPDWQGLEDQENRLVTFVLRYPRIIHSELMTHRAFSRNAASSRAIPIHRIREEVLDNPAMLIRWGKNGKGMQDHGFFTPSNMEFPSIISAWLSARDAAVESADRLAVHGLHKQIVNRVLEPYMWMETVVTASYYQNFFALRVDPAAQPEFQYLAYLMLKGYVEHEPAPLQWGEMHKPFGDAFTHPSAMHDVPVSVARCARVSYKKQDGTDSTFLEDIARHDDLIAKNHWSPTEHCAMARAAPPLLVSNFGPKWYQYRKSHTGENQRVNPAELLERYEREHLRNLITQ